MPRERASAAIFSLRRASFVAAMTMTASAISPDSLSPKGGSPLLRPLLDLRREIGGEYGDARAVLHQRLDFARGDAAAADDDDGTVLDVEKERVIRVVLLAHSMVSLA
jgi:hypothetical protein